MQGTQTQRGSIRGRDPSRVQSGGLPSRSNVDWPMGRELMTYPVEMLRRMRQDMDRFFEDFSPARIGDRQTLSLWTPRTEMFDRDGKMIVRVELPGLRKEDVKVLVANDSLVVEGERRQSEEQRGRGYYESEWTYGRFYREIPLPDMVDPSDVKANFENGVLEISMPQPQNVRERREIPIESS